MQRREPTMSSNEKVWLVTGAGRGLGVDIVRAALAAGHKVVATGRDPGKLDAVLGSHDKLMTLKPDITHADEAQAAAAAVIARFGQIDVLVNNAGNFYAGFFEELTPKQMRQQIDTLLFGPMNVTPTAHRPLIALSSPSKPQSSPSSRRRPAFSDARCPTPLTVLAAGVAW